MVILDEVIERIIEIYNIDIRKNTREMDYNYLRQAFSNAMRKHFSTTQIGKAVNRNHSTIVHYAMNHRELMKDLYYERCYQSIESIFDNITNDKIMSPQEMMTEIHVLQNRLNKLQEHILRTSEEIVQPDLV